MRHLSLLIFTFILFQNNLIAQNLNINSSNSFIVDEFNSAKADIFENLVVTDIDPNYIPAYWGSYRIRECFCSRDICHQAEAAHLLGLDVENFSMLKTFAADAPESNDYWPKWSFDFFGNPYFMDADFKELPAPFENVEKIYEQYLWTGDDQWILNDTLFTYCQNTVTNFVSVHDQNNNGIAEMHTDLSTYWEQEADGFIEAGDSYANQYRAVLAFAGILEARGNTVEAAIYFEQAVQMRANFENLWFDEEENTYIRGFDVDGNYKTDFGHENSFFMPMKGITDLGPKTKNYVDFCHKSIAFPGGDNFTEWNYNSGINIEAKTYLPQMAYYNNRISIGWHWLNNVMKSNHPYPEVSFLIVGNLISGMMGLTPDAPNSKLISLSKLNYEVDWLEVNNLPIGSNEISLRHDGQNKSTFTNTSGEAIVWEAQFYGEFPNLLLNGTNATSLIKNVKGANVTSTIVVVNPGETVSIETPEIELEEIFLSDLTWQSVTSSSNDAKRDLTVQGYAMTIDGKVFEKGLGIQGESQITYNLNGNYYRFTSDYGVDDSKHLDAGIFIIEADGVEVFNSGVITSTDELKTIDINISGVNQLTLITTGATNSWEGIFNWGNARVNTQQTPILHISASEMITDDNENGSFDPGEIGTLNLIVENLGILSLETYVLINVESDFSAFIQLDNDSIMLGDLDSYSSITSPLVITISDEMPRGANFDLHLTASNGTDIISSTVNYTIPSPEFEIEFSDIYNDTNGNGIPEPGESFTLPVSISNVGNFNTTSIQSICSVISDNASLVTILNSEIITTEGLNPGEQINLEFEIQISENTPKATIFTFKVESIDDLTQSFNTLDYTMPYPIIDFSYNGFDMDTDGDGILESGEVGNFYIQIKNSGTGSTEIGELLCQGIGGNSILIDVLDSNIALDVIQPNQILEIPIQIQISEAAPSNMIFNLEFTYGDGLDNFSFNKSIGTGVLWLSDAKYTFAQNGWGELGRDKNVQGNNLKLNDVVYEKGLGLHANAEIRMNLEGNFSYFISDIGVDDAITNGGGSVEFFVYLDGELAYSSGLMDGNSTTQNLEIDVIGVDEIKLILDESTFGISSDHADWAGAYFTVDSLFGSEYGCTDTLACNFDLEAVVDNGTCEQEDECGECGGFGLIPGYDCEGNCTGGEYLSIVMEDSYGDGWNGNILSINGMEFTLENGNSDIQIACLDSTSGCILVTCDGGNYQNEITWILNDFDGNPLLSGGAPFSGGIGDCELPIFGCIDLDATNFDANANEDDGSCVYPIDCNNLTNVLIEVGGGSYQSEVSWTLDSFSGGVGSTQACISSGCLTFNMFDSYGDGWNGNTVTISLTSGTVLFTGTLESGSEGSLTFGNDTEEDCGYVVAIILGCTDQNATNFNAEANEDDGSCTYPINCDNLTTISIEIDGGEYQNEVSWTLNSFNGGIGISEGCIEEGCHTFVMHDSFGDGWNGNEVIITTEDGLIILEATLESGSDGSINFGFNTLDVCGGYQASILGCTESNATNYDPYATVNDGSCEISCESNLVSFTMNDTWGDGWNGAQYSILSSGDLIASGTLDTGLSETNNICLNTGCYSIIITEGNDPTEISWTLGLVSQESIEVLVEGSGGDSLEFSIFANCNNENNIFGCNDLSAVNYNPLADEDNGTCVYTVSPWDVIITDANHTIIIDTLVSVDGESIEIGDLIGVFYYNDNNELQCGGYSTWNGNTTVIAAQGDDLTNSEIDGFGFETEFILMIWDVSENIEISVNASYSTSLPNLGLFAINGISEIYSLSTEPSLQSQLISLDEGWSIFSTYIEAENMDMVEILSPIVEDLIISKNGNGLAYLPEWNFNGIGDVIIGQGYQIKMNISQDLVIEGIVVLAEENPISLNAGWNMIGYTRQTPASAISILAELTESENLIIAKDYSGNAYLPAWGFNGIGDFKPGEGYQLKIIEDAVLNYLANGQSYRLQDSKTTKNTTLYYSQPTPTDQNMTIIFPEECWKNKPLIGVEIAAYDSKGNLIGAALYTNPITVLTLWGNDLTSIEKDGLYTNEVFKLELLNGGSKKEIIVEDWLDGTSVYLTNGINIANSIDLKETLNYSLLFDAVPNPANQRTIIEFEVLDKSNIEITLNNLVGNMNSVLVNDVYEKGQHSIELKTSNLNPGIYFYTLKDNFKNSSKKLTVVH